MVLWKMYLILAMTVKERRSMNKQSSSVRHTPRKNLSSSSIFSQSSFNSHASDASMVSTVLDESLIREQTEVDHFWGLDDEGDLKGSDITLTQGNGDLAAAETQTTMINGYTCSDCSMLSERKEVLTAYSAPRVPTSRIYSRDRSQKHASSIWFWGFDGFLSLLPSLNRTRVDRIQRIDDSVRVPEPQPDSFHSVQPPKDSISIFDSGRISELEKQMAFVSDRCHHHDEKYSEVMLLLHSLQDQVAQMSDKSETLKLIQNVMSQHLKDMKLEEKGMKDIGRASDKEGALWDDDDHSQLLSKVKKLELELSQLKSELLSGESVRTSCEKMDVIHEKVGAQVKESVKLMLFGDQQEDFPDSLLQWLTSNFVSKSDLQTVLRDLELQILKNITLHMSVTNQKVTSEVVTNAVTNAGISGITEAQVQIIVNNALKLYSQDKIGLVDFALESGGGSILSTRCSETHETKTALISLFGVPLWYFSQSPRVVIQPDMYPGNCWAFKGSQGYLVIRLSMKIYPTAFTMEHVPKALSPAGNITSAPRSFAVYQSPVTLAQQRTSLWLMSPGREQWWPERLKPGKGAISEERAGDTGVCELPRLSPKSCHCDGFGFGKGSDVTVRAVQFSELVSLAQVNSWDPLLFFVSAQIRYMSQGKHAEARELMYSGALLFFSHNQQNSAADLSMLVLESLEKSDAKVADDLLENLAKLFSLMDPNSPERVAFVSRALKWSSGGSGKLGHPKLHQLLAITLWKEQNYSESRYHFLHSTDGEGCANMLVEYSSARGYRSEVDMFVAQAVLQFLCLKNKTSASVVFTTYTQKHPSIEKGPPFVQPLLNFIWFLLLAVDGGKLTVFTVLCEQYQPSLKRDPMYNEYLDRIGQLFFGVPPKQTSSYGGLLGEPSLGLWQRSNQCWYEMNVPKVEVLKSILPFYEK
ncbi:sun domain-containing protein 1 isoform x1 [Limosa lapponica baueri]|uniref:Sun domain-containing protein 1 isoform x1 n=1 Tax=Limosa lapponica baueri TaxID=1758121 RepID=A0A2I0TJN3_LIMLA|nr:sun domain-containing protein 1 isoform x1 [Limosa lapponica baueri]